MSTVNDWRPKELSLSDRLRVVSTVPQGQHFAAYQAAEKDAVIKMGVVLVQHLIAHSGKIVAYRAQANWQPDYRADGFMPQDEFVLDARIVAVVHQDEPRVFMGHSWGIPAPEPSYEVLRVVPEPYEVERRLGAEPTKRLVEELRTRCQRRLLQWWRQQVYQQRQYWKPIEPCSLNMPWRPTHEQMLEWPRATRWIKTNHQQEASSAPADRNIQR